MASCKGALIFWRVRVEDKGGKGALKQWRPVGRQKFEEQLFTRLNYGFDYCLLVKGNDIKITYKGNAVFLFEYT